jgi:hypothetical protein
LECRFSGEFQSHPTAKLRPDDETAHVSPVDPVRYVVAGLGLCAAAWLASYIPSRRTATVNPVDALRAE